jgi:hypothetical protein
MGLFFFPSRVATTAPGPSFRFPRPDQRVTINGRTGSGKTVAGAWLLSEAPFDRMPYVIIDTKAERLFRDTPRIKEIDFSEMPKTPGVFRLTVLPHELGRLDAWLWKAWGRGSIGVFIDEGYQMPDTDVFRTLLTTGRSRLVPVITLSQRPSWVPRFVFSEADFYGCFHLNDKRDRATVAAFTPLDHPAWNLDERLPPFNWRWYDIGQDFSSKMSPVPDPPEIQERFDERLKPKRKII